MTIERRYTLRTGDAYGGIAFAQRPCPSHDPDLPAPACDAVEVPAGWSTTACDILIRRAMRRRGVPARLMPVPERGVPAFLWRHVPDHAALEALPPQDRHIPETSARQVFDRMAGAWAYWGWKAGCFADAAEAQAYLDEMRHMLARQMGAPAMGQWAVTGLHWAYGLDCPDEGHWHVDPGTGAVVQSDDAWMRPSLLDAAIQSAPEAEAMPDLWRREARQLRQGGVTGTNLGGVPAPMADLLAAGDAAAVLAPGGARDRAVICDIDHPGAEDLIAWRVTQDDRRASRRTGARLHQAHLNRILAAIRAGGAQPDRNPALAQAMRDARHAMIPERMLQRALELADQGISGIEIDDDRPVPPGALALRVGCDFMAAAGRPGGHAAALWRQIGHAAWAAGDPALQFRDHIAAWHTCPQDGSIRASAPAGDFLFLDDTGCPRAWVNLAAFWSDGRFDAEGYAHACGLWALTLEIGHSMTRAPSGPMARNSHDFRPLGLGYTNLGGLLMAMGLAYDGDAGRAVCGAVTAIMTGATYLRSARIAARTGPFAGWAQNGAAMLRVIGQHRAAAQGLPVQGAQPLDAAACPDPALIGTARALWDQAAELGRRHGFRNAQATAIAPAGPVTHLLDADTDGIAPATALVHDRPQPDGSHRRTPCAALRSGLRMLGLGCAEARAVTAHLTGHASLARAPHVNHAALAGHGFGPDQIARIEAALTGIRDIRCVFNQWTLGRDFCRGTLGIPEERLADYGFDLLAHLGFTPAQIAAANAHVCGSPTLQGAPITATDASVFACDLPAGAHLAMMAAAQGFLSGGIGHSPALPARSTIAEVQDLLRRAHALGLKAARPVRHAAPALPTDAEADAPASALQAAR